MKEIHVRRNWPWWKSQILQKYSNGTHIWQTTMSFENDKYSVDKDTYEWCLRQSEILEAIYPQMNIQMRNHKLLTQIPGELEHAVKCRCSPNCTLDDIENTLQDIRKRTNIGKYSPYKSSGFKEKQPFRVEFKDKPRERVEEVAKKKNYFHICGSTDHYATNCPTEKRKVYFIEKVPKEESPTEDSESDFMRDAIREKSEEEQDPRDEVLVEYQEETPLEIQDIQLEAGMPQDTANKNLCKHTQDAQTFLVTPTKGMAYIHGTSTKMTVYIETSQHPLLIDTLSNQGKELQKCFRKDDFHWDNYQRDNYNPQQVNIRLHPEFVVLDDAHIQGFLLGTEYHRMYGIDIYNSKNRHITIGTNKENKFSLHIYQISAQDPLEDLLNEFREGQLSTTLTSKQKLSLLKMLRNNRPEFAIGEEPLGKIRGNDIELYLDVERPYPPMLRGPPYAESLETRKEIEKHINELLDMDIIRKIGQN
ncbi:hypothetical protein O181_018401 [Austropuccinia psidii MF-1]|uniref:Uncharacterized protein n=1 Tax=Austropuccinia psidii MF-1 TaxID=1389203 RepID=A0A9Q3C9K1_9BASI|nr:hypothetical protein [Austropuccinia psidii MF-1]